MEYYNKYLKYKNKYLYLKQYGGDGCQAGHTEDKENCPDNFPCRDELSPHICRNTNDLTVMQKLIATKSSSPFVKAMQQLAMKQQAMQQQAMQQQAIQQDIQQQGIYTLGNFLKHGLTDCDMLLTLSKVNQHLSLLIKVNLIFYVNILKKTDPEFAILLKDTVFGDDVNKNYQVFVNKCKEKEYNYLKSTGVVVNVDTRDGVLNINALDLPFTNYSNYVKLKHAYIDDRHSYWGVSELNAAQIDTMIELKRLGINDRFSYYGARNLNAAQIKVMIELMREGIDGDDSIYYAGASELNDTQIDTMLELMRAGVDDHHSYLGAKDLNYAQIKTLIYLKRDRGQDDISSYNEAKEVKDLNVGSKKDLMYYLEYLKILMFPLNYMSFFLLEDFKTYYWFWNNHERKVK